jgi:bacterioferritin-associated ferredoxin
VYACICRAVTVAQVAAAVDAGATSIDEIGAATRAGTDCSTCHDHLEDIVAERCSGCPLAEAVA